MLMRGLMLIVVAAITLGGLVQPLMADGPVIGQTVIEDFTIQPENRWRSLTDHGLTLPARHTRAQPACNFSCAAM